MIQKPDNYESVETYSERPKLPPGGYVLRITGVKVETNENNVKSLAIAFDISEGEFMGFFKRDLGLQKEEFRKWKGSYRIVLDYSEEWKVRKLKAFIKAVEESNSGFQYVWEKEETQLMDKYFGGIFNRKEWENDGKTGWYTRMKYPATVEAIRNGDFTIPDDDPLNNSGDNAPEGFSAVSDDDIPF